MSVYNLQDNNFVALNETSGILQNMTSSNIEYVVCVDGDTPTANTGIRINPSKKLKFCQTVGTSYVRVIGNTKGDVIVTPNECSSGGGGGTNTVVFNHIKDWSPNTQYSTGTLVIKDTKLYKCVVPNNRETFVASDWVEIGGGSGSGISSWASDTAYNPNDIVLRGNTLYVCIDGHTSSEDFDEDNEYWMVITDDVGTILPDWKPREKYEKDEIVNVGGFIYRCKREHISLNTFANAVGVTGDEGDWELISWVDWEADTQYIEGQVVYSGGALYKCIANHISDSTSITNDMSEGYEKWVKIGGYELPTASSSIKGGIKVGNTLEINAQSGALNIKKATKTQLGGIKVGDGLDIKSDGTLSVSTSVGKDIVPWTANTSYKAGQYVIYNNNLYECKTANNDASFDATKWQLIGGSSESVVIRDWESGESYVSGDLVIYNNVLYKCDTANDDVSFDSEKWISIGETDASLREWKSGTSYKVGNFVVKNNKLYKCATANSDTVFDSTKWTEIGDMSDIQAWESGTSYAEDDYVIYNNRVYQCTTANDDTTFDSTKWTDIGAIQSIVEEWQSGKDYSVGALVIKDKVIYKCTTANEDVTFDPDNWEVQIDNSNAVTVWSSGTSYKVGDYVVYEGKIYKCKTSNTDVAFDTEKWEAVDSPSGSYLEPWETKKTYKKNQLVEYQNDVYMCLVGHTSNIFTSDYNSGFWLKVNHSIPNWKTQKLYVKDSVVSYDGEVYRCLETHSSGNETPFDSIILKTYGGLYVTNNRRYHSTSTTYTHDLGEVNNISEVDLTVFVMNGTTTTQLKEFTVEFSEDGNTWDTYTDSNTYVGKTHGNTSPDLNTNLEDAYTITLNGERRARYIKLTLVDYTLGNNQGSWGAYISFEQIVVKTPTDKWEKVNNNVIPTWKTANKYEANTLAYYDGKLYLCKTAHTSGTFATDLSNGKWEAVGGGAGVVTWAASKAYKTNVLTVRGNALYVCTTDHTSSSAFDTDLSAGKWMFLNGNGGGAVNQPLGSIIAFMGTTAPANYLACDGTVYNITDYQELADFINAQFGSYSFFGGNGTTTFAVPDLRGEFLRGTGTNSHTNQGDGANVGEHQDGTLHIDTVVTSSDKIQINKTNGAGASEQSANQDKVVGRAGYIVANTGSFGSSVNNYTGQYTSRPTNTSVLYCIRYNSPYADTNTYSTTEQRIGTWIDGKPLYQKTFQGTTPSAVDENSDFCSIDITNCVVISFEGFLKYSNGMIAFCNDGYRMSMWVENASTVRCRVMLQEATNTNGYVTIKYTKTTD